MTYGCLTIKAGQSADRNGKTQFQQTEENAVPVSDNTVTDGGNYFGGL